MQIGLGIGIHGQRRLGSALSRVLAALFGDDEPGFLFTADPATCFTDTAGTTQAGPGDPVALWLDQSGNGNHATQPTTANRPILGRKPKGGVTENSIGSGFDITEPGKPDVYYLFFGGSADPRWMQTPVITPGTDKAQVFAGVRALQGETRARITGYTGPSASELLSLEAPGFSDNQVEFFSRKGQSSSVANADYTPPKSFVVTGLGDLNFTGLRYNGSLVSSNTGNTGTADFEAREHGIGIRLTNNDRFFNGEISALTTRFGPNLDTNQIEQVEAFIASKVAEDTI